MDLTEIANILEPHKIPPEKLQELENDLLAKLKELGENAYEDRGVLYYYLLRIRLFKNTLLEDQTVIKYLKEMRKNFRNHENVVMKLYRTEKDPSKKKILGFQLKAFYNIIESYMLHLERLFERKGFTDRMRDIYISKMLYREKTHFLTKQYGRWLLFYLWRQTSRYGESFAHWGMTNLLTVLAYTVLYYFIGAYISEPTHAMILSNGEILPGSIFNYFYYSIVTFTTLGYGDIVPVTLLERIVASIEVIQGYVMLGVFLTILQKRL